MPQHRDARPGSRRDLMGRMTFTEYLLPAGDRPRADREAALLPRSPAGRDRRAWSDADRAGRAHDLRRRARLRCRARSRPAFSAAAPSCSARRSCAARARRGAGARRRAATPGRGGAADRRARSAGAAKRCRASAIRSISRSIRAPSASSSSPTRSGSPGRHVDLRAALRAAVAEGLGPADADERLDADRRRACSISIFRRR